MLEAASVAVFKRRIYSGMGAYGYAQAVTVATQLISLPLFLLVWDLATYGRWIALSAVPFYLSLADGGISSASGNRMISLIAQGKRSEASSVFQSAFAFLLCAALLIFAMAALAVSFVPEVALPVQDWQLVFILLSISVLLGLFCSLAETIFKATEGYAAGTYMVTTGRLVEWAGGIAGLLVFKTFLGVAAAALATRIAYTIFAIGCSHRRTTFLKWGLGDARRDEVRQIARPGLMFLVISLTNALSLQGFTILVAVILGPIAAAIFNTYRTIARVVVQASGVLSNPLWPELTALHGRGDKDRFWRLYRKAALIGLAIAVGGSLAVFAVSPYLLEIWTHGKIAFDARVAGLFMLYAAINVAWQMPRVVLLALNRHTGLAWKGVVAAVISLLIASLAFFLGGISTVLIAMIVGEVLMWLVCSREVRVLFKSGQQQ